MVNIIIAKLNTLKSRFLSYGGRHLRLTPGIKFFF